MSDDMASDATTAAANDQTWGRVIIAGGTDWANVGKKDKSGKSLVNQDVHPDLYEPHVMRPLCNVPIVSVHGSGCASHFVAIDTYGAAWLWGRNFTSSLGVSSEQTPVIDTARPARLMPSQLGAPRGTKFVHAAVGRGHTVLVASNGSAWASGTNTHSQCGRNSSESEITRFTLLENLPASDNHVIQASAGVSFTMVLTNTGKVYAFGSAEHGQLGNGATGEDIGPQRKVFFDIIEKPREPVRGLEDKVIKQIASGNMHSLAVDDEGLVYAWGDGGYCRTGFGDQKEVLIAKPVNGYFMAEHAATRAWKVFGGPSCSIVIDQQKMLSMAGKFKMTGDGSSGQPYTYFKPIEDLQPYKVETAASGGMSNFAVAPDEDPVDESIPKGTIMTVGWGQQCTHGELGMGNEAPLSSTRPNRLDPLAKVHVFDIAAGQHSTVFLARPGDATSNLPRHPILQHPLECVVCNQDKGDDNSPLECEKCETPYHLSCLNPPLKDVPEDEWFCEHCTKEAQFEVEEADELAGETAPNGVPPPKKDEAPVAPTQVANDNTNGQPAPEADDGANGDGLKRKAEDAAPAGEDAEAKKPRVE
ncbi:RCC1/BLIP-II [Auriculariales sp. MPI-PUGE-AT-0066]|nr:RCC1/BLIP-II [Auriculariales sp. MPI-PUGE-AT-0066]